jgi:hypothetical protein
MRRASSSATKCLRAICFDRRHQLSDRGRRNGPMRHVRLALLAGLIPAALAASVLLPAGAGAATRGFHVYNFSSLPLFFNGIQSGDFSGGAPNPSHILQPGVGFDDFEQTYVFGQTTEGVVSYAVLNGQPGPPVGIGTFTAHMQIQSVSTNNVYCTVDFGACDPQGTGYIGGSTLTYLDPPGTVHNFAPGQGQAQAATLNQFCAVDNAATCKFTPTSETQVEAPIHQVGNALINTTDVDQDTRVTISDTVGSSDSVGVDVKAGGKIAGIVDASITAKYSHEWTREHTFTQDVTVHCPPHSKCSIMDTAPMLRDTGNFTVDLGNTTWNLPGVYFDSPNPAGNGAFLVEAERYAGNQRTALPPGRIVLRGSYTLPRHARVNPIAEPKLHLAIAGSRTVAAGHIASYQIDVSASQPDNQLAYALRNVRVVSTRAGHRVRRSLLSALPRGHSRTLLLRLTVPNAHASSSAQRTFCVDVNAAARHAIGAHARFCATVASAPVSGLG